MQSDSNRSPMMNKDVLQPSMWIRWIGKAVSGEIISILFRIYFVWKILLIFCSVIPARCPGPRCYPSSHHPTIIRRIPKENSSLSAIIQSLECSIFLCAEDRWRSRAIAMAYKPTNFHFFLPKYLCSSLQTEQIDQKASILG
jgi:hypothetical protein